MFNLCAAKWAICAQQYLFSTRQNRKFGQCIMALSIRQLNYFISTAEYGQVSQAAINQNISQSAITAAIKDLEQTVGVPLFNRTTQGMELTASGRQFLSYAYE